MHICILITRLVSLSARVSIYKSEQDHYPFPRYFIRVNYKLSVPINLV